jgi:hypothetical protein
MSVAEEYQFPITLEHREPELVLPQDRNVDSLKKL